MTTEPEIQQYDLEPRIDDYLDRQAEEPTVMASAIDLIAGDGGADRTMLEHLASKIADEQRGLFADDHPFAGSPRPFGKDRESEFASALRAEWEKVSAMPFDELSREDQKAWVRRRREDREAENEKGKPTDDVVAAALEAYGHAEVDEISAHDAIREQAIHQLNRRKIRRGDFSPLERRQ